MKTLRGISHFESRWFKRIALNAFYYGANPAVVINLIWMTMNVVGIVEGVSQIDILDNIPTLTMELPRPVAV